MDDDGVNIICEACRRIFHWNAWEIALLTFKNEPLPAQCHSCTNKEDIIVTQTALSGETDASDDSPADSCSANLSCSRCHNIFTMTKSEQEYHEQRYLNVRILCRMCRTLRDYEIDRLNSQETEILCVDCDTRFEFTGAQQKFYREKNLSKPTRCTDCSVANKRERELLRLSDTTIVCTDCDTRFEFTGAQQKFYREKNLSKPSRCTDCSAANKRERELLRLSDTIIVCTDCDTRFEFTGAQQKFYREKNLSKPSRCTDCSAANKRERELLRLSDITIVCTDCDTRFEFTGAQQKFYREKNLSKPTRCTDCSAANKRERELLRLSDTIIVCKGCYGPFEFTGAQQKFYREKDLSKPTRCPGCRASRGNRSGILSYGLCPQFRTNGTPKCCEDCESYKN